MPKAKKNINWEIVQKQIEAGCSAKEIYGDLCCADTFYDRFKEHFGRGFSDIYDELYSVGDGRIKFTQYMKALSGNIAMLCRLGDVRLGQNKVEEKMSQFEDTIALRHENMLLRAELAGYKEHLDANQSKTE